MGYFVVFRNYNLIGWFWDFSPWLPITSVSVGSPVAGHKVKAFLLVDEKVSF